MTQDHQSQEAVLAEFLWEPSINAAHIGVAAENGVVTLTGHVGTALHRSWFDPSTINVSVSGNVSVLGNKVTLQGTVKTPGDKWKAGSIAWGSAGTTEVENDLVVTG